MSTKEHARRSEPGLAMTRVPVGTAFLYGCAAGLIGVAAMTAAEKLEQTITHRPNSLVPGRTLDALLRRPTLPDNQMFARNMAMHYGQGMLAGGLRGIMGAYGIRGPFADFMFTVLRLCIDQTLENVTGVGAPPWTWPVGEQVVDILHKGVFAFVTGWVTDWLICSFHA